MQYRQSWREFHGTADGSGTDLELNMGKWGSPGSVPDPDPSQIRQFGGKVPDPFSSLATDGGTKGQRAFDWNRMSVRDETKVWSLAQSYPLRDRTSGVMKKVSLIHDVYCFWGYGARFLFSFPAMISCSNKIIVSSLTFCSNRKLSVSLFHCNMYT
jgi:hypothetical protein